MVYVNTSLLNNCKGPHEWAETILKDIMESESSHYKYKRKTRSNIKFIEQIN